MRFLRTSFLVLLLLVLVMNSAEAKDDALLAQAERMSLLIARMNVETKPEVPYFHEAASVAHRYGLPLPLILALPLPALFWLLMPSSNSS